MSTAYEKAVSALYQAAPEAFVAERQRLAAELKGGGDKENAAKVAKLARPALSAWVVNQLWWQARIDFEQLFETAQQLRAGKVAASSAHRQVVTKLSARAQRLLVDAGHSPNDATMRRVAMTLSGLAAAGGFEPDLPGALAKDREPAGFEAFGSSRDEDEVEAPEAKPGRKSAEAGSASKQDAAKQRAHEHRAAEQARREAAAHKKRLADEHARQLAERHEASAALHAAKAELSRREAERNHAAKALAAAEQALEHARAVLESAQESVSRDRP